MGLLRSPPLEHNVSETSELELAGNRLVKGDNSNESNAEPYRISLVSGERVFR